MNHVLFVLFALLYSSNACLFAAESQTFNNKVLYLLDEANHTYLFRGKLPQYDGKFCYHELKNQIYEYLLTYNRPISPNFKLISISLLNSFVDKKECLIESNWFLTHQNLGCLWRYPLFGYLCNPSHIPLCLRKALYWTDIDGLRYLMQHLKELVNYDYGEDVVIYIHCRLGKDRTGEAAACYLMQYKGWSYHASSALNRQIAKRKLRCLSMNAIQWYAHYLQDIYQLSTIGEID